MAQDYVWEKLNTGHWKEGRDEIVFGLQCYNVKRSVIILTFTSLKQEKLFMVEAVFLTTSCWIYSLFRLPGQEVWHGWRDLYAVVALLRNLAVFWTHFIIFIELLVALAN